MESCEPLAGHILRVMAEPIVEGNIWIAAFDGVELGAAPRKPSPSAPGIGCFMRQFSKPADFGEGAG